MYNFSASRGEIKGIKRKHGKYKAQNKIAEMNLSI